MRILLVVVIVLTLTACGQSYDYEEEYLPFLGSDINQIEGIEDYELKTFTADMTSLYSKKEEGEGGIGVSFRVKDGSSCIYSVSFSKDRYDLGKEDFHSEMDKLVEKYGDPSDAYFNDWEDWDIGSVKFLVKDKPYSAVEVLHIYNSPNPQDQAKYSIIKTYSSDCQ